MIEKQSISVLFLGAIVGGIITILIDLFWVNPTENDIRALIEKSARLETQLSSEIRRSQELENSIQATNEALALAQAEAQKKNIIRQSDNIEKTRLEKDIDRLRSEVEQLENENSKLRNVLSDQSATITGLRLEASQLRNAIEFLDLSYANLNNCLGEGFREYPTIDIAREARGEEKLGSGPIDFRLSA